MLPVEHEGPAADAPPVRRPDERVEVAAPDVVLAGAELRQVAPGEDAGVVAVVEADAQGVAADGFGAEDADLALFSWGRRAVAAMALGFRAGAFNAQEFVGDSGFVAIVEADEEFSPVFLEAQFGGPGRGL